MTTLIPNWLTRCAQNFPTRLALACGEIHWTFADLDHHVAHMTAQLASIGMHKDDRVALLAANGPAFVVFVHALMRLGAILVPLNTRLTAEELIWQVRDVQASFLVSDEHFVDTAHTIGQNIPTLHRLALYDLILPNKGFPIAIKHTQDVFDLDATQAVIYTSGTTGQPKGALITYGMHWWNAIGSALNLSLHADDRWLACLPFFHIGGLSILMRSVIYGIGVVVQEKFDALAVNTAIQQESVTIISVVAVMLQRMLAALEEQEPLGKYPETLRCVLLGGGPAPRPLLEACTRRNIPVVQTYGMTEAGSQAVTLAPTDALRKLGSAGRPLLPVQLRIMQDGQPVEVRQAGEIELRGPTITPGYAGRAEATARAFHDGWFATGDIGYLDAEGYLYVLDRRVDLIISGGENIYPAEIEAALLSHPAVEEAGVYGQVDVQWGHVPVAFVHLYVGSETTAQELLVHTQQHVAQYKVPKQLYIVAEPLPRNSAGKLLRRELYRLLP